MDMVRLTPKIQPYPWGDATFIPSLLGIKPTGTPCAELWFGTHPGGESTVGGPDGEPLGVFLAAHAEDYLGEAHLHRYGPDLPFLLKVLAIQRPLSLQVHPSREQARRGYKRELPLHKSLPFEQWNYKDDRRKAEVLYALTPVTAMCGFRPVNQLVESLSRLTPRRSPAIFPFLSGDGGMDDGHVIERFFTVLYTLERRERESLIGELATSLETEMSPSVSEDGLWLTPEGIARSCMSTYPDDPGLFAPFFLNVIHLEPGQAIYLEPRTLHAYVKGHGVELMTNSDNVLRGGLTRKKVDISELLSTVSFKIHDGGTCPQVRDVSNRLNVLAPTEDFLLGVFDHGSYYVRNRASVELLFCTSGSAELAAQGGSKVLSQGECLLVAASIESYQLTVRGTVFSASLPE